MSGGGAAAFWLVSVDEVSVSVSVSRMSGGGESETVAF